MTKIEVMGSTVDFYTFTQENTVFYYFDTSLTGAPEPMINAMRGLELIKKAIKSLS